MTAGSGNAALDRADQWNGYDVGYCLRWVRGPCWDVGSYYGSAIEAWNGARDKHPGDRNPPVGAPLFYRGGSYGHVVIARGPDTGRMRSTDCQSAGRVSDEAIAWVERTWGYEYLGWTGDLNGVTLPLEEEDMPTADEIADAVWARMLAHQNSAPDGRAAGPTLSGIRNIVERLEDTVTAAPTADEVAKAVWTYLLHNQASAPDGRAAGSTLSGIRNIVEQLDTDT